MKFALIVASAFALFSLEVSAASGCYSSEELKAEQLLRLHSELMVITVTCKQSSTGQDLVGAYSAFTKANIDILHDAEQTMIDYYKKNGGGGVAKLDKLRTVLANEYGQKIADVSAPVFCANSRDKVLAMKNSNGKYVLSEADRMTVSNRSYAPLCAEKNLKVVQKGH